MGKALLCLSRFCDLGQIMPWSALLSGLLGEVTEKILSNISTRAGTQSVLYISITMTIITTLQPLDLGLVSILDTKRKEN